MQKHKAGFYERCGKRLCDMVLSFLAIIILSPVMIITAILVRINLGNPVVFKQKRPGKNERIFYMYKFRSMTDKKDGAGNLLPDEVRLTGFGRKLRSTSLDELPELFNILKGDMSIVGPRPLLVQYLPLYNEKQRRRHEVRPGVTGLAQINGRNSITWEEKFDWDVDYVDSVSFLGDCKIVMKTIKPLFAHTGISSETSATMEVFTGTKHDKEG